MQDAHYLRSQAELCLQMARSTTDDHLAENLNAAAAQYFDRALAAEESHALQTPLPPSGKDR
jgi:hypothetical protein